MEKTLDQSTTSTYFCKISLENSPRWVHGIITYINLDKNIAEIFLSAQHFKTDYNEGQKVVIKSLNSSNESLFTGTVTKKVISIRKQAITIKIDQVLNFDNNRKYERYNVSYAATIKQENNSPATATLTDISFGGIQLISPAEYEKGDIMDIQVYLNPETSLSLKGLITRKSSRRSNFMYGVILQEIDEENSLLLNELIEYLTIKKNHLIHELKIFRKFKYTVYIISILSIIFLTFILLTTEIK